MEKEFTKQDVIELLQNLNEERLAINSKYTRILDDEKLEITVVVSLDKNLTNEN